MGVDKHYVAQSHAVQARRAGKPVCSARDTTVQGGATVSDIVVRLRPERWLTLDEEPPSKLTSLRGPLTATPNERLRRGAGARGSGAVGANCRALTVQDIAARATVNRATFYA